MQDQDLHRSAVDIYSRLLDSPNTKMPEVLLQVCARATSVWDIKVTGVTGKVIMHLTGCTSFPDQAYPPVGGNGTQKQQMEVQIITIKSGSRKRECNARILLPCSGALEQLSASAHQLVRAVNERIDLLLALTVKCILKLLPFPSLM